MYCKVILLGHVGQTDFKVGATGTNILNFSVATSSGYYDKQDKWVDKSTWHKVVVFGKSAESLAKRIEAGDLVLVDGRLEIEQYETKDGNKATSVKVLADTVKVKSKNGGEGKVDGGGKTGKPANKPATKVAAKPKAAEELDDGFGDDEIPF